METMIGSEAATKDKYLAAITSVWWDIDDCGVPEGCDGKSVAENIKSALSKLGYRGDVSISAYGSNIPESVQGISLNHVVTPGVNVNEIKDLLVDLMSWAADNPAPSNILLICGEKNTFFSGSLHRLGRRGYNILLAQPTKTSSPLVGAAKTVWLWTSILAGGSPFVTSGGSTVEAMYKAAATSVWWHIDHCGVPPNSYAVSNNIKSALSNLGYHGPVCISAYGDTAYIPHGSLFPTEINMTSVSHSTNPGEKYEYIKQLLVDLLSWTIDNPAPANILLLSGNPAFSPALHGLVRRGYNILLSVSLPYPARTLWHWTSLLAGGPPIGNGEEGALVKFKGVNTSVWWDMEACKVPEHCNFTLIAENIRSALSNLGYQGPVSIFAYGETSDIPQPDERASISLNHVPAGGVDKEMVSDMFVWAFTCEAPANLLLISGDEVFSRALSVFGEMGHNVLLCASLPMAAKTVWHWANLCLGGGSPIGGGGEISRASRGPRGNCLAGGK